MKFSGDIPYYIRPYNATLCHEQPVATSEWKLAYRHLRINRYIAAEDVTIVIIFIIDQ